MALEQLSERTQERSQQVIGLLSELSERLRKAEGERDNIKRELLTIRECIQDLNDRNDQTEKAIVAIENRFDGTETQFETAVRRLEGMEESVDRQSTELLSILRKIEERFDQYDREYKNHASSIVHYGDTLDRFDKKLEKLMQDKARMARKLDALEFDLADTENRLQSPSSLPARTGRASTRDARVADMPDDDASAAWVPPTVSNDLPDRPDPLFQATASDTPSVTWGRPASAITNRMRRWAVPFLAMTVFLSGAAVMGVQVAKHPEWARALIPATTHPTDGASVATTTDTPTPSGSTATVPATDGSGTFLSDTAETTSDAVRVAGKTLPDKNFFSPIVRAQIDAQVVNARKIEDQDTARLMAMGDRAPLSKRVKRDTALPRPIQAIEDKAISGNPEAQHDMGALYTSGQSGVTVDYAHAGFWFEESARQGIANARYNLGVLSQQGLGRPKDIDLALSWYRAAALLEHPEARYNLGIAYLEGIGVSYNPAMAAGYFEQAAKGGVVEAAYNLGLILENGMVDGPRPFEAMFWYTLARDGGSDDGAQAFNRLAKDLKIDDKKWKKAFSQMITERPDVKPLADSRTMRGISLSSATTSPTTPVRVHHGATTASVTPRTTPPPPPALAQNADPEPEVKGTASATTSTPKIVATRAPVVTAKPDTADDPAQTDAQTIARIQALLQEDGLYTGKPDGTMNPGTINAVRRYQTKYKITVDGKPTTDLLARMIARRLSDSIQPAAGTPTSPIVTADDPAISDQTSHDVND